MLDTFDANVTLESKLEITHTHVYSYNTKLRYGCCACVHID